MAEVKIIQPNKGSQDYFVRTNVDVAFFGGILGGGKPLEINELVLTPNGWVRNGDLRVGDTISTPFGGNAKILQIFDHQHIDLYELKTADGRTSKCGLEHLWAFRTYKQITKYRRHKDFSKNITIDTTEGIIQRLEEDRDCFLPIPHAQQFDEKDFVIHPYVLGVMIGDGCLTDSAWRCNTYIAISSDEMDIVHKVAELCGSNKVKERTVGGDNYHNIIYFDSTSFREYCNSVGLTTYSYNKFIPEEYKWGSIEQRKQLLFGLFDTDGCIEEKNRYSISTTSENLAKDVVDLCRSLGYKATIGVDRRNKYTSGAAYDVRIITDDIIFSSQKHYARYRANLHRYKNEYKRTYDNTSIKSIEYIGKGDARCILIDDPMHLYITNDFIVTHNTFGEILCAAEPALDPNFRAVYFRRTFGQLKQAGGLVDDMKSAYGKEISMTISESPKATFSSGATATLMQVQDENPKKIIETFKGLQADLEVWDEITGFEWFTFTYIMSRCRGKGKWTGKIRATTNPVPPRHWVHRFLKWYIGADGYIPPEKSGVVRYFYINGEKVEDVVWGYSKEEVYEKCKISIDRKLAKLKGATYQNLIKSFTFILGNLTENTALLKGNADYVGNVAATGGKMSDALLSGNWLVNYDADDEAPISNESATNVYMNDPQDNGDRWITADLADTGTDNFLAIAWSGFHIIDILILTKTTPKRNAEALHFFAVKHGVGDNHIIYDAIRGTYINDYIEEAVPFVSYRAPMGMYGRLAYNLKAECYLRLVKMINDGRLSMSDTVAYSRYIHHNLHQDVLVMTEFVEECSVVRFKDMPSGKKQLLSKKEMNAMLGKGRSMDLLDPIAMRMLPVLDLPYGDELTGTMPEEVETEEEDENIYEDNFWA